MNRLTNDVRCYKEKQSQMKDDRDDNCHIGRRWKGTMVVTMCRNLNERRVSATQRSGKGQSKQEEQSDVKALR